MNSEFKSPYVTKLAGSRREILRQFFKPIGQEALKTGISLGVAAPLTLAEYEGYNPLMGGKPMEASSDLEKYLAIAANTAFLRGTPGALKKTFQGKPLYAVPVVAGGFGSTPLINMGANLTSSGVGLSDSIAVMEERFDDTLNTLNNMSEAVPGITGAMANASDSVNNLIGTVKKFEGIPDSVNQIGQGFTDINKTVDTNVNTLIDKMDNIERTFSTSNPKFRAGLGGIGGLALAELFKGDASNYDNEEDRLKQTRRNKLISLLGLLGGGAAGYYADDLRNMLN